MNKNICTDGGGAIMCVKNALNVLMVLLLTAVAVGAIIMAACDKHPTNVAHDHWTRTLRYSGTENLNGIAAGGNGMFVVVGDAGTILSSPDGVEWTERSSGTHHALHSVVWGDGMFVAGGGMAGIGMRDEVGDSGTIITSADGVEWTVRGTWRGWPFESIAWGNGRYVAGRWDSGNTVLISDGGVEWIEQQIEQMFRVDLVKLVHGDELFMGGHDDCGVSVSTDGINWERAGLNFNDHCYSGGLYMPSCAFVSSIAYGNGIFLLMDESGGLAQYEKGKGWKHLYCGGRGHSMIYDGTRFVIVGDDVISFTENGSKFEQASIDERRGGVSIAYNGDVYIVVNRTEIETLSKGVYE